MEDWIFWAALTTIFAGFLAYAYYKILPTLSSGPGALPMLEEYNVEMPDKSEFEAIFKDKPASTQDPKYKQWHKKACKALLARAKNGLRPFHKCQTDIFQYTMMKKQGMGAVSDELYEQVEKSFQQIVAELQEVEKIADSLQPGMPGWGMGIYQEATNELRVEWEKEDEKDLEDEEEEEEDGDDDLRTRRRMQEDDDLMMEDESGDKALRRRLRFSVGDRVECNMGQGGFMPGMVVGDWRLPYQVILDNGTRCRAPADSDQLIRKLAEEPKTPPGVPPLNVRVASGMYKLWWPFRFNVGDRVMIKMPPNQWMAGSIVAQNYQDPSWPPHQKAAYQVKIADGRLVFCPRDLPQLIVSEAEMMASGVCFKAPASPAAPTAAPSAASPAKPLIDADDLD